MNNKGITRPNICDCCYDVWNSDNLTKVDFGLNLFVDLCPDCYKAFCDKYAKKIKKGKMKVEDFEND